MGDYNVLKCIKQTMRCIKLCKSYLRKLEHKLFSVKRTTYLCVEKHFEVQ